ncbi:MAG: hypothetical protein HY225_01275 [Candidatus Vogelbacteria bacterium]|nr:hypothetical protein [Candidatus Vogelbacteria bacterium]
MFGFDRDEYGSQERFYDRIPLFKKAYSSFPVLRYYLWWLVHNCVSHPLIGIAPIKIFFVFHDWTSTKMHPMSKTKNK